LRSSSQRGIGPTRPIEARRRRRAGPRQQPQPNFPRRGVIEPGAARGAILKNGLKFVDGAVGTGDKPQWGQVLKISYKAEVRQDGKKPRRYDEAKAYLVKHGTFLNSGVFL